MGSKYGSNMDKNELFQNAKILFDRSREFSDLTTRLERGEIKLREYDPLLFKLHITMQEDYDDLPFGDEAMKIIDQRIIYNGRKNL